MELPKKSVGSLNRYARDAGKVDELPVLYERLKALLAKAGENSMAQQNIIWLGQALLHPETKILAVCCPDYLHTKGVYTFGGMDGGVSLLARHHIAFLQGLQHVGVHVQLVYADVEAFDVGLQRSLGMSSDDMLNNVRASVTATRDEIESAEWSVTTITDIIPDFLDSEGAVVHELRERMVIDGSFRVRIANMTLGRSSLYGRIGSFSEDERIARTLRTAAQYLILARYARPADGVIICNHTTENLVWFKEEKAGVLHNPVSLY